MASGKSLDLAGIKAPDPVTVTTKAASNRAAKRKDPKRIGNGLFVPRRSARASRYVEGPRESVARRSLQRSDLTLVNDQEGVVYAAPEGTPLEDTAAWVRIGTTA